MTAPVEAPAPEAPRWVGKLIASRYRLLRVLGVGGHGAVYEAQHELTDRRFAVKLLLSDSRQVKGLADRLVREAKAASRVRHPNVVEVIDVGIDADSGRLYLIEELLDGDDLRARMKTRRRMTTQEVRAVMGPVLDGLGAAHEQGVVHRDLKPGNVMLALVAGAEVPKLIDFGISKVEARGPKEDDKDGPLTRDGMLLGTPDYMAPEQARGAQSVDARADLWSVGVLLYEMLAGVRPFRGNGPAAVIVAVATETPTPLATHRPDLPAAWCALVHRCLARSPDQRFATARSLREALDAAGDQDASVTLDDIPIVEPDAPDTLASAPVGPIAPPVAPGLDFVLDTNVEAPFTEPPAAPRALPVTLPSGRDSWRWVLASLALFVVVGVAAWTKLRPGPAHDRPVRRPLVASGRVDAGVLRADPVSLADQDARTLPQRLSVTQQRSVMIAFEPRARACAGPRFFGSLPVTLTVRGDGTVRLVRVGEALRGSAVERCVMEAGRSVTVPRFAAREMEIGWVYVIADQSQ